MTATSEILVKWLSAAAFGALIATAALANHDTDCTAAGGINGPGQLDCTLPDFIAPVGSTTVLTSSFVYTPSVENNPATCAVGTLAVDPTGEWLSIDSNVIDATGPDAADEVVVSVDPSGLPEGTYQGLVRITLTVGGSAPQCPSVGHTTGQVAVRLRVVRDVAAPLVGPFAAVSIAALLGLAGIAGIRKKRT